MSTSTSTSPESPSSAVALPPGWWPHLSAIALVVVEICWVVVWYRLVIQISYVASPARSALVLGAVMLAAYGFALALESLRLLRNVQFTALLVLFIASLLISSRLLLNVPINQSIQNLGRLIPGEVLILFTVLWLWWRGVTLARQPVRPVTAWRRFELGLFLYLVYVLIAFRTRDVVRSDLPGLGQFVFFLFMGLLAVVFARVSYVGIAHRVRKNPFDRRWLASTFLILGLTVAVALVVASVLTGQYILLLEFGVEILRVALAAIVFLLSLPGLLLSTLFVPLIPWLRRVIAQTGIVLRKNLPEPIPNQPGANEMVQISPTAQMVIFWVIVGALLVVVFLRVRRQSGRGWKETGEEPESLLREGDLRRLLRKAWDDAAAGMAARLRPARRVLVAARIRRIYAQLLELSAELNRPRQPNKTPLEFRLDLGELFPKRNQDLELLTQAYVKVRYGELPETQSEMDELEAAWERVAEEGKLLKRAGQHKIKTADQQDWQRPGV